MKQGLKNFIEGTGVITTGGGGIIEIREIS